MRILVTGGAGFVGTNLIKRLLSDGHNVISIDNYTTGNQSNHQIGCTYYDYDIQQHIISQDNYISISLGKIDAVFHLAAVARIQPSFEDPLGYFNSNALGTFNIVDWCSKNNIPLIYAGSSSKHSGRFKNPYTFSKDVGEDIITLYLQHYGLDASIARFYNVYGPHQLLDGGYETLIGKWIHNITQNKECIIYGDGTKRRDFTHVDDIVDGLVRILEKEAWGYSFELGNGKNYSVNEIAEMFGITPKYESDKPGEAQDTLCDRSLAEDVLGWVPKRNVETYIKELKL